VIGNLRKIADIKVDGVKVGDSKKTLPSGSSPDKQLLDVTSNGSCNKIVSQLSGKWNITKANPRQFTFSAAKLTKSGQGGIWEIVVCDVDDLEHVGKLLPKMFVLTGDTKKEIKIPGNYSLKVAKIKDQDHRLLVKN